MIKLTRIDNISPSYLDLQGSKNASLFVILASCLFDKVHLSNVPDCLDVRNLLKIYTYLGGIFKFENNHLELSSSEMMPKNIPNDLSKLVSVSILFHSIFPGLEIGGRGGCNIPNRRINIHIESLKGLGLSLVEQTDGSTTSKLIKQIQKANVKLSYPSVSATVNVILFAIRNNVFIELEDFAKEPEVMSLVDFFNNAGAKISMGDTMIIEPCSLIKNIVYEIPSDRIDAITKITAAALVRKNISIPYIDSIESFLIFLKSIGCDISVGKTIDVKIPEVLKSFSLILDTYPAVPTDAQPFIALLGLTIGNCKIDDNVFSDRFDYAKSLKNCGLDISIINNRVEIGRSDFNNLKLNCSDIRGQAALAMTSLLSAETTLESDYHIKRGYQSFFKMLNAFGVKVEIR